jgi:hypothetical protein
MTKDGRSKDANNFECRPRLCLEKYVRERHRVESSRTGIEWLMIVAAHFTLLNVVRQVIEHGIQSDDICLST